MARTAPDHFIHATELQMKHIADVASVVTLSGIRLVAHEFSLKDWSASEPPAAHQMGRSGGYTLDTESGVLISTIKFSLRMAENTKESQDDPPISISASYEIAYTASDMNGLVEKVAAFGEINGTYNAWPYWRELVHTSLSRMSIQGFIMPVCRVVIGPPKDVESEASLESKN